MYRVHIYIYISLLNTQQQFRLKSHLIYLYPLRETKTLATRGIMQTNVIFQVYH